MCKIEFELGNAAYRMTNDENEKDEGIDMDAVSDTVKRIAEKISDGFTSGPVMDSNGNDVGWWSVEDDE